MIYSLYKQLKSIADNEFNDIVINSEIIFTYSGRARKLRLDLMEGTFIDIWYSLDGSYSLHWEQREVRDAIYRHDNAPHSKWSAIKTFPRHCHNNNEVSESFIPGEPEAAVREFLKIVRKKLLELKVDSR